MTSKAKEFRKQLAEEFAKILEEKELDWKKEWKGPTTVPQNAKSNAAYRGINRFHLGIISCIRGYSDPRWATYKQVQDMGCKLVDAAGKGVKVEYWFPFDKEERKTVSWEEFRTLTGGRIDERYTLTAVYSTVFNAEHIEGLKPLPEPEQHEVAVDELANTLAESMGVEIINDGGNQAFYRPAEDKIHLPHPEFFFSDYAYNSTALHELAHSTGASTRLNRDLQNIFGSQDYAFEELIAEITSCFMSSYLDVEQDSNHIDNHKAYVQSWIKAIKEKPETLTKAIAEAERASAYMEYHAGLIPEVEYEKVICSSIKQKDVSAISIEQKKELHKRGPRL